MSSIPKIDLSASSYFSFEALKREQEEIETNSLIERALLSCRKEQLSSVEKPVFKFTININALSEEKIDWIVSNLTSDNKNKNAHQHQSELDALGHFLIELQDHIENKAFLKDSFQNLPPHLQKILSRWYSSVYKESKIEENPQILLQMIDKEGNNCLERLIECYHKIDTLSLQIQELSKLKENSTHFEDHLKDCTHIDTERLKAHIKENESSSPIQLILEGLIEKLQHEKRSIENIDPDEIGFTTKSDLLAHKRWDPNKLYEQIAKRYVERFGIQNVVLHISKIADVKIRIAVAKFCAECNSLELLENIKKFNIEDQKVMIEIANIYAEKMPHIAAKLIKNFDISDPKALGEIAKLCAKRNGSIAEYINNFGIKDQKILTEIAKLCGSQNGELTAFYIQKFQIQNNKSLIEIAKICAIQNGSITAYIKNFRIDPTYQDDLIEIAKLCAIQNSIGTACNIKDFGIKDPNSLLEIAKLCAKTSSITANYIKNFEIDSTHQDDLIEIAKLCATQNSIGTACNIKDFGIKDPNALFEIAQLCATEDGLETALNIKNFNIHDEKELTEIAQLCANQNGRSAKHIKNFRIEDQKKLIEIAKLYATKDGIETARNIKDFGIKDPNALFEIAQLCAKQSGESAENIKNFEIEDQKKLIEIAKLCANSSGANTAYNIKNFGIKDLNALFEIAQLCAKQSGSTAKHIKNFEIEDQKKLIEIAKLCANNSGVETAYNIKNFGIEDQKKLIEIAKLCAKQNGWSAKYIQNFEIDSIRQDDLIEIAKMCAISDGFITAVNIKNFGITDQNILVEIAKLCAKQSGWSAKYIQNFEIDSIRQDDLIEIAKLCANQDARGLIKSIKNFEIKDPNKLIEIAKLCALLNGEVTLECIVYFGIRDIEVLCTIAKLCFLSPHSASLDDINSHVTFFSKENRESLRHLSYIKDVFDSKITESIKGYFQNTFHPFYSNIIAITPYNLIKSCLPSTNMSWKPFDIRKLAAIGYIIQMWEQETLPSIFEKAYEQAITYRNGDLSFYCLQQITACQHHDIFEKCAIKSGNDVPIVDALLPMVSIANWINQSGKSLSELQHLIEILHKFIKTNKRKFKNMDSGLMQDWLMACQSLDHVKSISPEKKLSILANLSIIDSEIQEKLRYVNILCKEGWMPDTIDSDPAHIADYLKDLILDNLKNDDYLELSEVKDLETKYLKTLAKMRQPNAWKTYETAIKTTQDPEVQSFFKKTIISILDENFKELRYLEAEKAPHAARIMENHSEIWDKWKKTKYERIEKLPFQADQKDLLLVDTDDWQDLFLSGTEVSGSCQNINSSPFFNKCLLATLLDGKNRLIAVKNPETGKIIARSIFRILWDPKANQPVLFQDRIYPPDCNKTVAQALNQLAKERAKDLGLPLYIESKRSDTDDRPNPTPIVSLGSPAPYEYEDAIESEHREFNQVVKKNGIFSISTVYKVN